MINTPWHSTPTLFFFKNIFCEMINTPWHPAGVVSLTGVLKITDTAPAHLLTIFLPRLRKI